MTPEYAKSKDTKGIFLPNWVMELFPDDLPVAVLFSQLLWWHQPGLDGTQRVKFTRHGHSWLLRADSEWDSECKMSERQVRRIKVVLLERGLVFIDKFHRDGAPVTAWRPNYEAVAEVVQKYPSDPPTDAQTSVPSDAPTSVGGVPTDALASVPSSSLKRTNKVKNKSKRNFPDFHPEAEPVCRELASLLAANGSKRRNVTQGWLSAADQLLTAEERDPAEVRKILDWSQKDYFWRTVIHSMEGFCRNYDKIRLAMERDRLTRRSSHRSESVYTDADRFPEAVK